MLINRITLIILGLLIIGSCQTAPKSKPCIDRVVEICTLPNILENNHSRPKLHRLEGGYCTPTNVQAEQLDLQALHNYILELEWMIESYESEIILMKANAKKKGKVSEEKLQKKKTDPLEPKEITK